VIYAGSTKTGNATFPAEPKVELGEMYGAGGVEFTGTLEVDGDGSSDQPDLVFEITQGDDYLGVNAIAIPNPDGIDLSAATEIRLTIAQDRSPYGTILSVAGTENGTGAPTFEIDTIESSVASGTWRFDVRAVIDGETRTINRGWCAVKLSYTEFAT